MTNADWILTLRPLPLPINGYMQQPHRKYIEFSKSDIDRLAAVHAQLRAADALAEASKPFLADMEMRVAYDNYRAAKGG